MNIKQKTPLKWPVRVGILVAGGLIIVSIAVVLWKAANNARRTARTMSCSGRLTTLALALHYYHEAYGSFPPAYVADESGKPIHSWRALVLEFLHLGFEKKYCFNEPWNSPSNLRLQIELQETYPRLFCCPNTPMSNQGEVSYLAVVGPETVFPGVDAISFDEISGAKGKTILLVEVANSGIQWFEPRDITIDEFLHPSGKGLELSTYDEIGPIVSMVDGVRHRLDKSFDRKNLKWMVTITGDDDP